MKKTKYNQGFSVLSIIAIVAVIAVAAGAYYYFNQTPAVPQVAIQSSNPFGTIPSSQSDNGAVAPATANSSYGDTNTSPATPAPAQPAPAAASSPTITDVCSYMSASAASSVFGAPVGISSYESASSKSTSCTYTTDTGSAKETTAVIVGLSVDANAVSKVQSYGSAFGATSVQGIGDAAAVAYSQNSALLFLAKDGVYGTVTVPGNQSKATAEAQAESVAKLVVSNL